jgi:hypothetical protein
MIGPNDLLRSWVIDFFLFSLKTDSKTKDVKVKVRRNIITLDISVSILAYELSNEQNVNNEREFTDTGPVFWIFSIV